MRTTGEHDTTEAPGAEVTPDVADVVAAAVDAAAVDAAAVDATAVDAAATGSAPATGQGEVGGTGGDRDEITRTLDRLSLTQALVDFELANARVLDLTARLVEANDRVVRREAEAESLRGEVAALRAAVQAADSEVQAIKASRAYRVVRRLAAIRSALRAG